MHPQRRTIAAAELKLPVVHTFGERWFLLTAGSGKPRQFNCMTIAWGSLGVMWNKPIAMIVVRPSRFTYQFLEKSPDFTLCAFADKFKKQLNLCGSKSGREIDKVKACGFTVISGRKVGSPAYDEAELIIECRKIYFDDFKPEHFLDPAIEGNYGGADYHRIYLGEIVHAEGIAEYSA